MIDRDEHLRRAAEAMMIANEDVRHDRSADKWRVLALVAEPHFRALHVEDAAARCEVVSQELPEGTHPDSAYADGWRAGCLACHAAIGEMGASAPQAGQGET